ncbi:Uncharacterised protein [Mycobacteroides abscessus subsp. abscessus]|nr:Uncharacterised protein [Mycobacteroides abscessus subsp. abscessus]SKO52262.1 Uncharacterised protein [Mycobacteroides abscessus subsp. abscessus]
MTPRSTHVALAAAALLLVSCTHDSPKAPAPWDSNDHTTARWIPNPVADLMSPEGTFIRATMESWRAAQAGQGYGLDAIRAGGYPGFDHAFNAPNTPWKPEEVGGTVRYERPLVGTVYYEIVALSRDGDRYKAGVCAYTSQSAGQLEDGQYSGPGPKPTNGGEWITFGPDPKLSADQQHAPPAHQKGPAKRPTDNVFGTWVLFDYDPQIATTLPQCVKFAPGTPTNLPNPKKVSEPPPTLPPDPGWPEGSKA